MDTLGKVLSADGTPIAYERFGTGGPVVILVAGALCTGITEDRPLAERLASLGCTAVTYDRRGRGNSGDTLPYAVAREVDDLAAVIDSVGGRAALHGNSSGAALAFEAAACGLPVTHVSGYEPPLTLDEIGVAARQEQADRLRALLAEGRRDAAVAHFISGTGAPAEVIEQLRRSPLWDEWEALAPTIAYDYAVLGDSLVPVDRISQIDVPLLVVNGAASFEWMGASADLVARSARAGRHLTLEGQTHMVDPDVLAPVLAGFYAHA
ncbi:alpha/beta fold hydrolase [Streptomyces indicus]|uniref:Pimeloyl-ACP methyl ester carboxylesterase n=1 Tax=Streptomyces indicus TaxID=417292 RepID=A0A1G8W4W6_9ACTN|nr:alpha/beta hydrolase [Streptomyces indicus]SDJ73332.1 Pimeloyl-ACP methyl ester carboxylesterase [Streptomyces indicus]